MSPLPRRDHSWGAHGDLEREAPSCVSDHPLSLRGGFDEVIGTRDLVDTEVGADLPDATTRPGVAGVEGRLQYRVEILGPHHPGGRYLRGVLREIFGDEPDTF